MFFKNLLLFLFTEPFPLDASDLDGRIRQRRFQGCGSLEPASLGWVPPVGLAVAKPLGWA